MNTLLNIIFIFVLIIPLYAQNNAPEITGQEELSTPEDTPLTITFSDLSVEDVDNTYPDDFTLTVLEGDNYTIEGGSGGENSDTNPFEDLVIPNPSSGVFIGQATIDGTSAGEGDWSAAFDEDGNIAGAAAIMINAGTAYINMPIYGDDTTTPEDDGMNAGESFILKVWDSSADAILEYPTSFDCWYNNNGAPMDGCGDFAEVYNFHVPPVDPNFSATLYVTSGDGTDSTVANYDLTFGFSPDATDGYDEGIDSYAPPAPPPPAFDAALTWGGDRYYTQILNGSADDLVEHEYDIALAYGSDNLITITWDNTGWSDMMSSCVLQDAFGGLLGIDIDMTQEDTLTLDNPAFNALKLKVTPLGVAYFSPSAFFTYSPEFPLTGDTLTFSDASIAGSSDIVSWSWDFDGDGAEDTTGAGPHTYVYDADSTYSATLTVTDNDLSDSYTASVTVAPPEDPTADFTYIANELTVSFTDGSQAGSGAITDWSWVFGDDSISTVQNPTHTYPSYNTYSVSLTVTNQYDLQDTKTVNVAVLGGLVIGPFTFYPNPSSGVFLGQVTIDGAPADSGSVIAAFDSASPEPNCAGAAEIIINAGLAYINFPIYGDDTTTDEDDGMNAGESFTLKLWDSSTGTILEYPESFDCWENQNGAPMSDCGGVTEQYNFETSAPQPPVADFSGDPRSGDVPLTVQFTDESTSGTDPIEAWSWDFGVEGFGDISDAQSPSYTYDESGVYTVMLTVTDASDTLESSITKESYIIVGTDENDAPVANDINVTIL
ncbi:MAG: PKD domain-containing protein, partial [Candidatus Marinimicrobia bacterium]|nr:PKD domain-containing protein [Candidatus Neomarinimicrobiota bacterium]